MWWKILLNTSRRSKFSKKAKEELEIRVEQRTKDLKQVIEQLQSEIAERCRVEEVLRKSDESYRFVVNNIKEVIFLTDRIGLWMFLNPAWTEITGFTIEETIGTPCLNYVHPDDCKRHLEVFQTLIERQQEYCRHEIRYISKNGSFRWIEIQARLTIDANGTITGTFGTLNDITERKWAEKTLRESESKFRHIYENSPVMMHSIDESGNICNVNRKWLEELGYTREEVIQQKAYFLMTAESAQWAISTVIPQFWRDGYVRDVPYQYVKKDGTIIDVLLNCDATTDPLGKRISLSTIRDITKHKQVQEELAKRERYLAALVEVQRGLLVFDGDEDWYPEILKQLGQASSASRVYLVENHRDAAGHLLMTPRYEWCAEGIKSKIDDSGMPNISYENFFPRWLELLKKGERIAELVSQLPDSERLILKPQGLLSILILPIITKSEFFGFIGFDNCVQARAWEPSEVNLLGAAVAAISLAQERKRAEAELKRANEELEIRVEERTAELRNANQQLHSEIIERKRSEEIIKHQALHDLLTGLPNRMLFNQLLSVSLTNASHSKSLLAVMFLDLDHFKTINDTLGHAVGDQLLQSVAERLRGCMREGDIIARWGGDEFTLLLPQINYKEHAAKIAQRILLELKPPFNLDGHCLHITSSVGIALYPWDGKDADTLIKNADAALYRAKEQGRNVYQYYTLNINSKASELLGLKNSLHHALESGEFVVYYQPQVNTTTGNITHVEALVRWQHPVLGLISPKTFIPLAEENGLIVPIGELVLKTACAQNKAWQDMGLPPLCMAINLSARQFQQPDLVQMVARVLEQTGLKPCFLELEITETIAIKDVDLTRAILMELHQMGAYISLDDFGTGYSALGYLKKFPFHTLKIDQSFVWDLIANPNVAAIITAIIVLGHGLNLRVVAEGVETKELKDLLRSLQCEHMQGYFFSRPLLAEDVTKLLRKA